MRVQQQGVPEDSQWRPIPGFPMYWVSQHGQVFHMARKRLVAQWSNAWAGSYVTLRRDGKSYSRKVELLVKRAGLPYIES